MRRNSGQGNPQAGFTLVELIVVMAIIGILAAIAIPQFKNAPQKAREAALKTDLHVMRESIDQYFADKARYPESLDVLVDEGYMRKIPEDPFTGSSSTWRLIMSSTDTSEQFAEEQAIGTPGIFDVKSGASRLALNGENVADW